MISVRLQVLPTGLISMLSYLFGLMYSEAVFTHLQFRFPFTSRMAEKERRQQLTETGSVIYRRSNSRSLREPKKLSPSVLSLATL